MPREQRYETNAERQKAYRERQRQEAPDDIPGLDPPAPVVPPIVKGRTPQISLEDYILEVRREALAYSKAIEETNEPWPIPGTKEFISNRRADRLERAERYARWRYQGYLDGEVASL